MELFEVSKITLLHINMHIYFVILRNSYLVFQDLCLNCFPGQGTRYHVLQIANN